MSDLQAAAQQALEALHNIEWHGSAGAWMLDDCKVEDAITNLRAALAEPMPDSKHATIAEWAEKQRKPMTEDEIELAYRHIYRNLPYEFDHSIGSWVEQGIKYAERVHGIGGTDE